MENLKENYGINDVYFEKEYVDLYRSSKNEIISFNFEESNKFLSQSLIKQPILKIGKKNLISPFYDAESPYGYSAINTNITDSEVFKKAFCKLKEFYVEQGLTAVFLRFNPFVYSPFIESELDFSALLNKMVVVDLKQSKENRWTSYPSKVRNILRRSDEKLTFKKEENIGNFLKMYYETMDKNKANEFYFFKEEYFHKMMKQKWVSLYSVNYLDKPVNMAFFLHSKYMVHYHLSANTTERELMKLGGNYLMLEKVVEVFSNQNWKYFNLGGGRTNSAEDGLYKFKKKFSSQEVDFHIGGIIVNQEDYQQLCSIRDEENPDNEVKQFLKYRF